MFFGCVEKLVMNFFHPEEGGKKRHHPFHPDKKLADLLKSEFA